MDTTSETQRIAPRLRWTSRDVVDLYLILSIAGAVLEFVTRWQPGAATTLVLAIAFPFIHRRVYRAGGSPLTLFFWCECGVIWIACAVVLGLAWAGWF
ncbi:MAG TPA: hypothetical protein VFH27_11200 [Longimicrobiaceae bacterium]|nr:hypothetical protein [Longimicrobiaceae bacterium]